MIITNVSGKNSRDSLKMSCHRLGIFDDLCRGSGIFESVHTRFVSMDGRRMVAGEDLGRFWEDGSASHATTYASAVACNVLLQCIHFSCCIRRAASVVRVSSLDRYIIAYTLQRQRASYSQSHEYLPREEVLRSTVLKCTANDITQRRRAARISAQKSNPRLP